MEQHSTVGPGTLLPVGFIFNFFFFLPIGAESGCRRVAVSQRLLACLFVSAWRGTAGFAVVMAAGELKVVRKLDELDGRGCIEVKV